MQDERKYENENVKTPEHLKANAFRWENDELKMITVSEATKKPEEKPSPEEVKEAAKALGEFLAQSEAEKAAKEAVVGKEQPKPSPQKMEEGALEQLAEAIEQPISAGEIPAKPEVRTEQPAQEQSSIPEQPRPPEAVLQALLSARTLAKFIIELDRMRRAGETIQVGDFMMDGEYVRSKAAGAQEAIRQGQLKKAVEFLKVFPEGDLRGKIEQLLGQPNLTAVIAKLDQAYRQ